VLNNNNLNTANLRSILRMSGKSMQVFLEKLRAEKISKLSPGAKLKLLLDQLDHRLRVMFPFRQIVFRSEGKVSCLNLSHRTQGSVAAVVFSFAAWIMFSSISVFMHERELISKDAQIADVRVAYRSLLAEVSDYQKKFSGIVGDLEENHALMLSLAGQNTKLREDLDTFKNSRQAKAQIESARAVMKSRIDDVENKVQSLAQRNFSIKDDLHTIEADLQSALTERNSALLESTQMRRDIKVLENKLVSLEEKENETIDQLTDQTESQIANMERIIEISGLHVGDLMESDDSFAVGQGGPFIAAKPDGRPGGRLASKLNNLESKLSYSESLQSVLRKMPMATPLQAYYITSTFGKRRDPVNKKWSMHYGLDMGSTPGSIITATSPGKVVHAGWKGNFGKLVEIDHGAGIVTRYGHLSKIMVKKGQEVSFGEKIGVIGSTGRSTGRHLHYEILFKDKGLDPMKFVKAGRYVFQE